MEFTGAARRWADKPPTTRILLLAERGGGKLPHETCQPPAGCRLQIGRSSGPLVIQACLELANIIPLFRSSAHSLFSVRPLAPSVSRTPGPPPPPSRCPASAAAALFPVHPLSGASADSALSLFLCGFCRWASAAGRIGGGEQSAAAPAVGRPARCYVGGGLWVPRWGSFFRVFIDLWVLERRGLAIDCLFLVFFLVHRIRGHASCSDSKFTHAFS